MIESLWILFFKLLIAHALTDTVLQGEAMSKGKQRHGPGKDNWVPLLVAHGLINAGGVWVATGSPLLALGEWVVHVAIDFLKNEGWYSSQVEQALHLGSKGIWMALTVTLASG